MVLRVNLILHFQDKVFGMSMVLMVFSVGMVAFALIGDMAHLLCAFVFKVVAVPCSLCLFNLKQEAISVAHSLNKMGASVDQKKMVQPT